jgi:hypothetical protein
MQKRTSGSRLRPTRSLIGSRIPLSITLWLLAVATVTAEDLNFKEFGKAPDPWKRGFVSGVSHYMTVVAQPEEEAPYPVRTAFQRCFAGATDVALLRHVEAYAAKNAAVAKGPMVTVVVRALFDFCRSYIEKLNSPTASPR